MASTTQQRIALEDDVYEALDAGDDPDEVRDLVESTIADWEAHNPADTR